MAMPNDAGEHHGEPVPAASGDLPTVAAPSIEASAPSSNAHDGARDEQIRSEAASAQAAGASAAKPSPGMPRAAILTWRPDDRPGATGPGSAAAARASSRAGGRRFALLAAGLTVAAAIGAIAGTAGIAGLERLIVAAPAVAIRHEGNDEVRVLKETVAHLRSNVKTLSDNLAALRTTINTSASAANAQFTKISEALERVERERGERRVTTLTPSPEPTGSVPAAPVGAIDPKAVTKTSVVEGWSLRKVYGSDSALVEGRYGVVEIEPGDLVPGLGRIQEIRRQDGHWVVVTSRGLVVSAR